MNLLTRTGNRHHHNQLNKEVTELRNQNALLTSRVAKMEEFRRTTNTLLVSSIDELERNKEKLQSACQNLKEMNDALRAQKEENQIKSEALKKSLALVNSSYQELQEISTIVTQDIHSPITSIKSLLTKLEKHLSLTDHTVGSELLTLAIEKNNQLTKQVEAVNKFMTLRKSSTGVKTVHLESVARRTWLSLFSLTLDSKTILKIKSLPTVKANESLMIEFFEHLFRFILLFKSDGPTCIDMTTEVQPNYYDITLSIRTSGMIQEPDQMTKVSTKMIDEHEAEHDVFASCKKILALHDGSISFSKEGKSGYTFAIQLPKPGASLQDAEKRKLRESL